VKPTISILGEFKRVLDDFLIDALVTCHTYWIRDRRRQAELTRVQDIYKW
jgi:hypothetical protein